MGVVQSDRAIWYLLNVLVSGRGLLLVVVTKCATYGITPSATLSCGTLYILLSVQVLSWPAISTPFRDICSGIASRCGFVRNFRPFLCGRLGIQTHKCLKWGSRKLIWKQLALDWFFSINKTKLVYWRGWEEKGDCVEYRVLFQSHGKNWA